VRSIRGFWSSNRLAAGLAVGVLGMASLFVGVPVAPECLKLWTSRFRSGAASFARPFRRLN